MSHDLTITEVVRELKTRYGIEVSGRTIHRYCERGLIKFRKTPERWYLIPESQLEVLRETLEKKGS